MKKKFYRWLAKWRLIRRYGYLNEVNNLMEEYMTHRILQGGSEEFKNKSRSSLVSLQRETKENENLIGFLSKTKSWLK